VTRPPSHFWESGHGGDIFGDIQSGRGPRFDYDNDTQLNECLIDYINWHRTELKFYEKFDYDLGRAARLKMMNYFWAGLGVGFAGIFFNPNYTSRNSFYLRKITPIVFGMAGWQYGYTKYSNHVNKTLMRITPYLPRVVRRSLESKDFRHIAL
jgi:hypothetical protein